MTNRVPVCHEFRFFHAPQPPGCRCPFEPWPQLGDLPIKLRQPVGLDIDVETFPDALACVLAEPAGEIGVVEKCRDRRLQRNRVRWRNEQTVPAGLIKFASL